jgi:hypothetical protein
MDYAQFREFFQQNFYYFLLGQLVFGAIIGAIPLLIGIKKGARNLGLIAFASSVLLATVSPLLCIIVTVVFIVFIVRKQTANK